MWPTKWCQSILMIMFRSCPLKQENSLNSKLSFCLYSVKFKKWGRKWEWKWIQHYQKPLRQSKYWSLTTVNKILIFVRFFQISRHSVTFLYYGLWFPPIKVGPTMTAKCEKDRYHSPKSQNNKEVAGTKESSTSSKKTIIFR